MTQPADVVVVGAGPAGSMAALALARRGARVRLLDRHAFPRDKPCGGGIRRRVVDRFPEVARHVERTVAVHRVHRVLMESPSGATVLATSDRPFYLTVRRAELDAALVALARGHGADVVEGARVAAVERDGEGVRVRCLDGAAFDARIVIAADGVNGVVTRAVGLSDGFGDDALAVDTMEETDCRELALVDPDTMYVAYGWKRWAGYGYVFPKATCVDGGVGFLLSFLRRLGGRPHAHHARFLEEAAARGIVRGRSNPANVRAYRIPLGGPLPRTFGDRVLVCGDAGGFVNGYTGEGIYHAMVSGELAGETAADALARGEASAGALAPYEARWRREIGPELADSLRIQRRLFANPGIADAIVGAASADPRLCRLFAAVALGEEDFRRRRREIAWRCLLAALRGRVRLGALRPWRRGVQWRP